MGIYVYKNNNAPWNQYMRTFFLKWLIFLSPFQLGVGTVTHRLGLIVTQKCRGESWFMAPFTVRIYVSKVNSISISCCSRYYDCKWNVICIICIAINLILIWFGKERISQCMNILGVWYIMADILQIIHLNVFSWNYVCLIYWHIKVMRHCFLLYWWVSIYRYIYQI